MAYFDWGNPPVYSTTAQPVGNPSTGTLCAEIDSTQLTTQNFQASQTAIAQVTWILGGDTNVSWLCEHVLSTGLDSTAVIDVFQPKTGTALSAQFVTRHVLQQNSRLRARVGSTFTANVTATIIAERLT